MHVGTLPTHERVVITGVPRSGKTTLAKQYQGVTLHTDDLIYLGWSGASQEASNWFSELGWTVAEGVAMPRALRKWLARNPKGKPCDRVIVLAKPHEKLSRSQSVMGKGVIKVLSEISPELRRRGVIIE